ncbi:MAG: hypothetical protein M1833_006136 [Piccolia ochrophora]|nr:MAG: hypothetical protein M1833_006136 [Piccolia ochrophora]
MPWIPTLSTTLGGILLAHAAYSAHEAASLPPSSSSPSAAPPSASSPTTANPLPTDIVIETLVAVLLLATGIVLGSAALRPIEWKEWAGALERKGREAGGGNPWAGLEWRTGFMDVRKARREFSEWVRERGEGSGGTG